ncbi:MAG: AAA family ATPase [Candidatus Bathyarchaeia archaeon]
MTEEDEFIDQWWHKHHRLRKIFAPALYITSWQYRLWRFLRMPPEVRRKKAERWARKIRKAHDFPKAAREDLVGRDLELHRILISARYHIFRDPEFRKTAPLPPPKVFILKGGSGSGKTFFAEVCQREVFEDGLKYGLLVRYAVLRPEDVYTMWYGRSAQQLSQFFDTAFSMPSIVLIDEFQAFGKKFQSTTEVGMEETRVQTVFLEKIDSLQKRNYRCIVLISTNEYEAITETLRRRGLVGTIDLDADVTREMLLEIAKRECARYGIVLPPDVIIDALEDSLRSLGSLRLTPADVVNAFNIVMSAKSEPLQRKLVFSSKSGSSEGLEGLKSLGKQVTASDFRDAGRKLKAYTSTEKTEAAKRAINRIAPRERYSDVGGLHGIKEEVIKEISLALNPNLAIKAGYLPPKGFIFSGPPGTGKTLLAKAIAGESNVWFYSVNGPSILEGHYGDPEKTIRDIFDDARKNAPAIIFFDEVDSIAPRRGTHDPIVDRVVSQLLTEIDGFTPLTNVVVIGATNRIEALDPALLERFTRHFSFTYPKNRAEKQEILEVHLRRYRDALENGVTVEDVLKVFEKKVLSPRKMADTLHEANRLRAKELEAGYKLLEALKSRPEKREEIRKLFEPDLKRLFERLNIRGDEMLDEGLIQILEKLDPGNYPLSLYHFEKALETVTDEYVEQARSMIRSTVRIKEPEIGKSYGLVALGESGQGGFVGVIEVTVNPRGSGNVRIVGSELGESILASAQDAFVYINSISDWRFKNYDVYVELITPAKGMEKQMVAPSIALPPVSGPSAGLAIATAMLSSFVGIPVDPTVIMTGAITMRGEVWPVGGLDYRGMGKIEAALADEYAKKLLIPEYNYERLGDFGMENALIQRGIKVIPVRSFLQAAEEALEGNPSIEKVLSLLKGFEG